MLTKQFSFLIKSRRSQAQGAGSPKKKTTIHNRVIAATEKARNINQAHQKADLLAFAQVLDQKLASIAQKFQISLEQVRQVCLLMKKSLDTNVYWQKWNQLYQLLSEKFLPVKEAVESAMKSTPRTTSLVENLNSRLRNYFFLRK